MLGGGGVFAFGSSWGWWADGGLGRWRSQCGFVMLGSLFGLSEVPGGHWDLLAGLAFKLSGTN